MLTVIALIAGMEVGGAGVELVGLYGLAMMTNLAATMWAAGWRCGCARSRAAR